MKRLKYILAVLSLLCMAQGSYAQYNKADKDEYADTGANGVVVRADPRLAIVTKKAAPTGIYSSRGYRVQIYSGNDRGKATRTKIDFVKRFPGVRTYMTYVQPQFRVKVGDFQSRGDAEKLYKQVSTLYSPCMIVPDFIVVHNTSTQNSQNDD